MKTDMELRKDVEDELNWEPLVNAAHIGVAAKQGVPQLAPLSSMRAMALGRIGAIAGRPLTRDGMESRSWSWPP